MAGPYDKILTSVGLLEGGKISQSSRDAFIDDVIGLLITGNANGKGGGPRVKIFNTLFPLPPSPGPSIFDSSGNVESLFWFEPDPSVPLSKEILLNKDSIWQKIFVDFLYEKTARVLDIPGATPILPVFDITAGVPGKIEIKPGTSLSDIITLAIPTPDKLIELLAPTPPDPIGLLAKLADLGLKPAVPTPPIPPLPTSLLSDIAAQVPGLSVNDLPPITLQKLIMGLIKLPVTILGDVFGQIMNPQIASKIPNLPMIIMDLIMTGVLGLLSSLGLTSGNTLPKLLIASLLVYVKNVIGMVCVDLIGLVLGAGGVLTKSIAGLTGLT